MSLSAGERDTDSRSKIPLLTRDNWSTWEQRMKDYILALDHDDAADIWLAYVWVPEGDEPGNDPANRDYLIANSAPERKLRTQHNKAFKYIRSCLSPAVFDTTLGLPHSVPKLLRHLRQYWNDGSVCDRDKLRTEYQAMQLEQYDDMERFITAFKNKVVVMKNYKLGLVSNDDDVLFQFNKSLPQAWQMHKSIVGAQGMTFDAATSYYKKIARDDATLPGTLLRPTKRDTVHFTSEPGPKGQSNGQREICRLFAKGKCRFGDRCKFAHPHRPNQQGGGSNVKNDITCTYCGKKGHLEPNCWKKKRDQKKKEQGDADSTHATREVDKTKNVNANEEANISIAGYAYAITDVDFVMKTSPAQSLKNVQQIVDNREKQTTLLMVLDGASTVGVVQNEQVCIDVRPANRYVKTGGKDKPTLIHCTKEGILPVDMTVAGRHVEMKVPVLIIPGFGCNILPECLFLKKNFDVIKSGPKVKILSPGPEKRLVLQGDALKHDGSWLFYVEVGIGKRNAKRSTALAPAAVDKTVSGRDMCHITHLMIMRDGEREQQRLLPLQEEYEACYQITNKLPTRKALNHAQQHELLLLWHERLGHRNMKDVAELIGLPQQSKWPQCISCIKGKSKRQALTGQTGMLHEAPRPGYAFSWDHAGPFPVKTWGGNNILSLKVCMHSGKLAPEMVNSTGTASAEWQDFVLRLETHFGRQVVARMITDSAPYFQERTLVQFNKRKGIVPVHSPPYTQELNGTAERTIGTVLGMTRTSMDAAQAPERAYGECIMAMCYILDRTPHKSGGKLTRLEKWEGRLLPRQHNHLKVWGCAAYFHLDFGKRGNINNPGKLDARAELGVFVGWDSNNMGYRIAQLPGHKIRTTLHVTFVEDHFPWRTSVPKSIGDFMTPDQRRRFSDANSDYDHDEQVRDALPNPRGRGRPQRNYAPSAAALEAIAAGPPSPPDEVNATTTLQLDWLDGSFYDDYFDCVLATMAPGCPTTMAEALAGPDAAGWIEALNKEVSQHDKNGTFSAPIDPAKLPPGSKAIPFNVVLNIKRDGTLKVRGIIKGFNMTQGIDFNETFAPVPCISALRYFFCMTAMYDWECKQGDVRTAFLCSDMDTLVHAAVPNWFRCDATGQETGYTIRQLLKGVPGIPQGSRLFHKKSHGIYTSLGLQQCKSEFCLYYCLKRKLFLIVWVDDIFLFFPIQAMPEAKALWSKLQTKLDLDAWQDVDDCLGCTVKRDRANRTIWLSQEPAAHKLLLRCNMENVNGKDTPMVANIKLSKKQCPSAEQAAVMADEQRWYRSNIASFIYLTNWTRPDMAYAVSKLCKFMHNPGRDHIIALKRLLRYLHATANYGLKYDYSPLTAAGAKAGIYGYYDASHADCPDTLRSTCAYVFYLAGSPISWHTKLHTVLTTSTNHSEYCAAAKAAREAKWWDKIATEAGFGRFVRPIDLFSDSKGAIAMTYNPVQRAASKHVDLADHYAREQQEHGTITISYVSTKDMIADTLTKPLAYADFDRHAKKLVQPVTL
jgi:hypothetical protein